MLYVQESWVNLTEGHRTGDSDVYETFTDDRGELYRAMQNEYGRCTGRVYVDQKDAPPKNVGWVFLKRARYDDSPKETFLLETRVTIHNAPPTRSVEYHYTEGTV